MPLSFSPHESEVLGLKIARGTRRFDSLPITDITSQVLDNRYDICKVKINAGNPHMFEELNSLGFPYQVLSVVYRNARSIEPEDGAFELPDGIEYEVYDGSQENIYKELVISSIGNPTGVSYLIWPLHKMISAAADLDMSVAYSLGFAHGVGDPKKQAWLLKDKGEYVGMFMGNVEEDFFEGTLYGVSAKHRKKGYGKLIYAIMKKICFEKGLSVFYTDVQIQNTASQKSTLHGGLNPQSIFFHVFLTPFASHCPDKVYKHEVSAKDQNELMGQLQKWHTGQMTCDLKPVKISACHHGQQFNETSVAETWKVYEDEKEALWTSLIFDPDNRITSLVNSRYRG